MASYTKIVKRYCGGDAIWTNKSNASTIIIDDFFGITSANATVSDLSLNTLLNEPVAKGSAITELSVIDSILLLNSVTAKGNSKVDTSVIDSVLSINNITIKGDSIVLIDPINSSLFQNNATVKGSGFIQTNTLNTILEINTSNQTGVLSEENAVGNVGILQLNLSLNQVNAGILDDSQYEILELNSYITNNQLWESYIKVRLILKSQLR